MQRPCTPIYPSSLLFRSLWRWSNMYLPFSSYAKIDVDHWNLKGRRINCKLFIFEINRNNISQTGRMWITIHLEWMALPTDTEVRSISTWYVGEPRSALSKMRQFQKWWRLPCLGYKFPRHACMMIKYWVIL